MKLADLPKHTSHTLPKGSKVFRVQRKVGRPGTVTMGPFLTPPVHIAANRFDVAGTAVGYVALAPIAGLYETVARRDALMVSQAELRARWLLELESTQDLNLLDLRPHAQQWPVLYANRYPSTQALAVDAQAANFHGILYKSAQQYGSECVAVFGVALSWFTLISTQELQLPSLSLNTLVVGALLGAELPLGP